MKIYLSSTIREKLSRKLPPVTEAEIRQCFANQTLGPLIDIREEHLTNPYTRWFVAETDYGRKLKVMYVPTKDGIYIKSAYDANEAVCRMYEEIAR